ncbi:MAG: carboxypeptidase regulatory-like domain-containing protein [Bryobacteraceae bacterium]
MLHRIVPLYLALGLSAAAQTTLGSAALSGTVTDNTNAAVPAAKVTLTEIARGLDREAVTNEVGRFVFPTIPAGLYQLRVSKDGFETYELTNLNIEVGQLATINPELKLGQVSTVMTVSGERQILIETESNTIGTVVDSARVDALPLNGRNFLQLALLSAGSNEATGRANVSDQTGHPGRSVIVAGNMGGATGYLINGIAVRGGRLGELSLNLSVGDIDQFKVQQSFFMPDQGPNPGLVNVTTKGGGNQFHGQAFWFVRNKAFDANNFFAPTPEDLKRNQYGFTLGGPVFPAKTWFHTHYEGLREITGLSARAYAATRAMMGGDFREVAEIIYDPATFDPGTGRRQPFPNQTIPDNRINAVSRRLLEYYRPGSSLSQRPQNLFRNPRNTLDDDQFSARLDHSLTPNQFLFGQFIWQDSPAVVEAIMPSAGVFYPSEVQMLMAQHTWTVSPTLVSTARIGLSRNLSLNSNEGRTLGPVLPQIGIQNTLDKRGITGISFQEYAGFGRAAGDLGNIDNNYQLDEGLNWMRGQHNVQFGTSVRYRRTWQQNANAGALGALGFQRTFTTQLAPDAQGRLVPQRANTGNSFGDFLLGYNTTGSYRGLPMLPYRFTQLMPYFQDTWKAARSLTLNYGISYFFATVPEPQGWASNLAHGFDESTGLLKFAALGEIDPRVVSRDGNNWTPRLGFAWQPAFMPRTVFRGGAGIYYSDTRLIELQFAMVGPPFNDSVDIIHNQFEPRPAWILGQNIFPAQPPLPLDKNYASRLTNAAPFLINERGRDPYMQQWNFSIQHSLTSDNLIELAYLGSSNHRLQNRYDYNQCRVGQDLRCDQATRPWTRYTSLLRADFNGNSSYNALLAKFQHRSSRGLNLNFEYTWAKALNDSREGAASTNAQITNCRRCDKGDASFDVRHRAVVSALYDLPIGRGRAYGAQVPALADALAGGWTVTGIAVFQTGIPFDFSVPATTGAAFVTHLPNRLCDGRDSNLAGNLRDNGFLYFRRECFETPRTGFFGNAGRNTIHGPGIHNWDLGIQKHFPIPLREGMRLQFRAEMFNAFNHAQFSNPAGNLASTNYGLVTSARQPRRVQFALKLMF